MVAFELKTEPLDLRYGPAVIRLDFGGEPLGLGERRREDGA
jgi:hypothetical protein